MDTTFSKTLYGYNKGQVNACIYEIEEAHSKLCFEHEKMHKAYNELRTRCNELERMQKEAVLVIDRYCTENRVLSRIVLEQQHQQAEVQRASTVACVVKTVKTARRASPEAERLARSTAWKRGISK